MTVTEWAPRPYDQYPQTAGLPHPRATVRPVGTVAWCVAVWAAPDVQSDDPYALTTWNTRADALTWAQDRVRNARIAAGQIIPTTRKHR